MMTAYSDVTTFILPCHAVGSLFDLQTIRPSHRGFLNAAAARQLVCMLQTCRTIPYEAYFIISATAYLK